MKEVSDLLRKGVVSGDFPGAAYAIIYQNGVVDIDFVGYRQLEPERVENDGSEIYDCASLTKVVSTTTMIFHLIESGELSLTTKVSDVLTTFPYSDIQVQDLLTHSSGLPADIRRASTLQNKEEVMQKCFSSPRIYEKGTKVVYSDIGYLLLGWMIEVITNQSLADYAKEVVFDPLGMSHTGYHPNPSRCAPTEFRNDAVYQGLLKGKVHDEKAFACEGEAGHAGMFSTVGDLAKFIYSLLTNDGVILQSSTVNELFPARIIDHSNETQLIRSYGWEKPTKGGTSGQYTSFEDTILHTGFTGCNIWIDRSKGIGFVMLSNAVHPKRENNNIRGYRSQIADLILSDRGKK